MQPDDLLLFPYPLAFSVCTAFTSAVPINAAPFQFRIKVAASLSKTVSLMAQ